MRRTVTVLIALAVFLAAATLAAAAAPHPGDADREDAAIAYEFDEASGIFAWWFSPAGGEDPECIADPVAPDEDGPIGEGAAVDPACNLVDVEGPNGADPTHGSFVSAFVHSLKDLEFDVPRGWLVRQIAHSELGNGDVVLDLEGTDLTGPPDHAKGPKKPKKTK